MEPAILEFGNPLSCCLPAFEPMSICHIQFVRIEEAQREYIAYNVLSPDLHDAFQEELLGQVKFDVSHNTVTFCACSPWECCRYYPPELWLLPEEERKRLIKERYQEFYGALWSRGICTAIMKRIHAKDFPVKFSQTS